MQVLQTMRPESRLPDYSKLAINWKNDNDVTIFRHDVIVNSFELVFFLLLNLVTGPSFMSISSLVLELGYFFYKWLTRNQKTRYTSIWVLRNILRLEKVRDTKLSTNVSNEMLLNAAKWHGYRFFRFWGINGEPTRGEIKLPPLPPSPRLEFRNKK